MRQHAENLRSTLVPKRAKWCPGRDLNPHFPCEKKDFKSFASADFATRAPSFYDNRRAQALFGIPIPLPFTMNNQPLPSFGFADKASSPCNACRSRPRTILMCAHVSSLKCSASSPGTQSLLDKVTRGDGWR